MEKGYVLAYDLGTGGVKAGLVDFDGNIAGMDIKEYPLYTPRASWAEQDPEDFWKAICAATKTVMGATGVPAEEVKGMAFCTQWKAIIPMDKDDNVLHRAIIWLDGRADRQAAKMNKILQLNYFKEKCFGFKPSSKVNAGMGRNIVCGADYWPKLAWFREELPEIYGRTAKILECNAYIKWRATGRAVSDMTNHFTKSFSKTNQMSYSLMLKLGKVDPSLFPDIMLPTEKAGGLTEEAAKDMGLLPGTPVFGGFGDIPAISVGSGCCDLGDTHAYFGSSGWIASMVLNEEGFLPTSPFSKEYDLLCFGQQAICLSFDWTVEQLYHKEKEELGKGIYDFLDEELKDVPAGSKGLIATHWIFGERPPFLGDDARGVFVNLSSQHDRRYMLNAMMESVCYSMKMGVDALEKGTGRHIEKLNAVGGGTLNDKWMQILADVLEIPVCIPAEPRHSGMIGTAYCALTGLGVCKSFSDVRGRIEIKKTFKPRPENFETYHRIRGEYEKLYRQLKPVFRSLRQED